MRRRSRAEPARETIVPADGFQAALAPEAAFAFSTICLKAASILDGKVRENFPVERDSGGLETFHEAAVGDAFRADRRVEPRRSKASGKCACESCDRDRPSISPSSGRPSRSGRAWIGGRDILLKL